MIRDNLGAVLGYSSTDNGALYSQNISLNGSNKDDHAFAIKDIYFNASKSNPIYGNSSTVQPPALSLNYVIKA
jgi:hypothetical protein